LNLPIGPAESQRIADLAQSVFPELVREVIAITEVPAPTFEEAERGRYVHRRMGEVGLQEVQTDQIGNVIGRLPGTEGRPSILMAAHMDTVFPAGTDVSVRVDGDVLRAPGVMDNSASVAVMLWTVEALRRAALPLRGDLICAATVCEEGLGNLRGIRAVMDRVAGEVDYVIPLDGSLGGLVRQGLPSRRLRLAYRAEGGHSWGAFGAPSAIHCLTRAIAQITAIRVPANPKTTYNVGTISGGSAVNTIAQFAEAVIDLRSLDPQELKRLEERVRHIVAEEAEVSGIQAEIELIGDRPEGSIPDDHLLCEAVRRVHKFLGIQTRTYPSSTDGNVPLSMGVPSVTIGVTLGGNGHRPDEYMYSPPLTKGLCQVLLLLRVLQETHPNR
jgi:tripeptide aminopeptidase